MNTKKTDEDEPRYGCDNWDRPNVKYRSKGRGVVPQRKVVTTGTARIRMPESMAESLTRHLRQGKEVHFTVGGKALFRAFPLASVDGRRIYAGMQAMTLREVSVSPLSCFIPNRSPSSPLRISRP